MLTLVYLTLDMLSFMGPFGLDLLLLKTENWRLKTENWKYCSKIIFKCVNNIVEPIFNIFKYVLLQCVNSNFYLCTINSCDFIVHALKKKKKKKTPHTTVTQNEQSKRLLYFSSSISRLPLWSSLPSKCYPSPQIRISPHPKSHPTEYSKIFF